MHTNAGAALLAALILAGCASAPEAPGAGEVAHAVVVAPYQSRERCLRLAQGERLDYRFESSEPVDFDIHYREGAAVLAPILREHTREYAGVYPVPSTREFCLAWQAGRAGAQLQYRWRVRGPVE